MKTILNILFFATYCFSSIYAQDKLQESCDCKKDFAFVSNYVENHYAGFSYYVTVENRKQYEQHKVLIAEKIQQETPS